MRPKQIIFMETRRVMRCLKRQMAKTVLFTARFHCFIDIECFNFFFCKKTYVYRKTVVPQKYVHRGLGNYNSNRKEKIRKEMNQSRALRTKENRR